MRDFEHLAAAWRREPVSVLDVRRRLEWSESHIEGALHVPPAPPARAHPDLPIWVHCQTGYRASIAASILHVAGREVTAIDDDYHRTAQAGLPFTTAAAVRTAP